MKVKCLLQVIQNKNKSLTGLTEGDKRGSIVPIHKHCDEELENVRKHINSFPSYESHYTRRTNDKKYLPAHLNIHLCTMRIVKA